MRWTVSPVIVGSSPIQVVIVILFSEVIAMIPSFSNVFSVTKNNDKTEVVLNFRHTYPDSVIDTDGKMLMVQKNEPVFSIVMTYENAKELKELLNKIID